MDSVFHTFRAAHESGNGYELSMTLSPVAPTSDPDHLRKFFRSTNFSQAPREIKNRVTDRSTAFSLPGDETNGWAEVYLAYWKAVGEILKAEAATAASEKVRNISEVRF